MKAIVEPSSKGVIFEEILLFLGKNIYYESEVIGNWFTHTPRIGDTSTGDRDMESFLKLIDKGFLNRGMSRLTYPYKWI